MKGDFKNALKQAGDFIKSLVEKADEILPIFHRNDIQEYADVIIRNQKGEILLLHRSFDDSFEPNKWSLPGGKVEFNELPYVAAQREVEEEINLKDLDLKFVYEYNTTGAKIYYFEAVVNDSLGLPLILDSKEHYQYQFVAWDNLGDYDLILNLGEVLLKLPLSILNADIEDNVEILLLKQKFIQERFDKGEMTSEEYREEIIDIKRESFKVIQGAFDNGVIDDEEYLRAYNSYQAAIG